MTRSPGDSPSAPASEPGRLPKHQGSYRFLGSFTPAPRTLRIPRRLPSYVRRFYLRAPHPPWFPPPLFFFPFQLFQLPALGHRIFEVTSFLSGYRHSSGGPVAPWVVRRPLNGSQGAAGPVAGCGVGVRPCPPGDVSPPRRCAQALLEHGASVRCAGGTSQDTPLHVAAQHGLEEHTRLYLDHGARVDARNGRGETALSAACGATLRPNEHERRVRLCALLLQRGAAPDARDEDERSPLHKACSQASPDLAHLLLRHGADATALDYGGASPLGRVLQAAACAPQAAPERIVQALLNHGAPTVWPDAFPKVRGGRGPPTPSFVVQGPACLHWVACSVSQTSRNLGTPWGVGKSQVLIPWVWMAKPGFLTVPR